MIQLLKLSKTFCSKIKTSRKLIVPQQITVQPLQQYFHVTSANYDFIIKTHPSCQQIYVYNSDSPSNLLKKNAIHIFPESVPQYAIQQKYKAHVKRLQQAYKKSFQKCKSPTEVFHLERRIKSDIRNKCNLIGKISGKYKHYNLFKSLNEINSQITMEQYKKNGVQVSMMGKNKIYPQGPIWLPTTDTYLKLLQKYVSQNVKQNPSSILDLGCGSGVLSFILAKQFKKANIIAVDNNKYAVQTCSINAASFQLNNILSFIADITKIEDFNIKMKENKTPQSFDLIITNPPWLVAKKAEKQSEILDGVYDDRGKFLASSFTIAKNYLKDQKSRFILIYSDLGQNLGLQPKSIQQLCKQNNLIVHSKIQVDYPKAISKDSPLSPYKLKSKIQLYEIGKS